MTDLKPIAQKYDFLTVREVADCLRFSGMTVYRLIESGKLPATKIGRSFRIQRADLEVYIQNNTTGLPEI